MGCVMSADEKSAIQRNKELDLEIRNERDMLRNEVKLLLLGAGESGKSTIVKQMRIIHENGFPLEECESYREVVYSNTIQAMQAMMRALNALGIPLSDRSLEVSSSVRICLFPVAIEHMCMRYFCAHVHIRVRI